MGSKSDRMAIEVAAQALKLPHRYCPEKFTNLVNSSILTFIQTSHDAAALRFANAASKSSPAADFAKAAPVKPDAELLKLAGIDLASLPVDDGKNKPMDEDNDLPPLFDLQAHGDVEMKDAEEKKAAPARSAFSLDEDDSAEKPDSDGDVEMKAVAGTESNSDDEQLVVDDLEDGFLDMDLEDNAEARDEADVALQEAEQALQLEPDEAELAAEELAQAEARAEMLDSEDDDDDQDSDADGGADGKSKKDRKHGDEMLLKVAEDGFEKRCARLKYF